MKPRIATFISIMLIFQLNSCKQKEDVSETNILYIHHSTGGVIWLGKDASIITRGARKISYKLARIIGQRARLPMLFREHNKNAGTNYKIKDMIFPKESPYGWANYPFDYYNIWVKNAGDEPYMEEPTLEMLTQHNDVIVFKHCFPVSNIKPDLVSSDITSDYKSIANYKLQYEALRNKLHEFPDTKFVVFTGAAQVKANITEDQAIRAKEFFTWVIDEWDIPGDNIFLWDFYDLETDGGLYLLDEYAESATNSHPNGQFAGKAVQLLFCRIIDVVENNGTRTKLTGENIQ